MFLKVGHNHIFYHMYTLLVSRILPLFFQEKGAMSPGFQTGWVCMTVRSQPIDYGGSDATWFPRLGQKKRWFSLHSCLLEHSFLEPSHQAVRKPRLLQGEAHLEQGSQLVPTCLPCEPPRKCFWFSQATRADTACREMCLPCQALPKLQIQELNKWLLSFSALNWSWIFMH